MGETWVKVAGFPAYEVSDLGRVRSFNKTGGTPYPECRARTAKVMKLSLCSTSGYMRVTLCLAGRREKIRVHKLVADAFLGPRPRGLEVCHRDGNASNNRLSNLRYATHKENGEDMVRHGHTRRTLTARSVRAIRNALAAGVLQRTLAARFGVHQTTISRVQRRTGSYQ